MNSPDELKHKIAQFNAAGEARRKAFQACRVSSLALFQEAVREGHQPYQPDVTGCTSFFLLLKHNFAEGMNYLISESKNFPPDIPKFGALDRRLTEPTTTEAGSVFFTNMAALEGKRVLALVARGDEFPGMCPVYSAFLYHSWESLQVLAKYWDQKGDDWRSCFSKSYLSFYGFSGKGSYYALGCGRAIHHHYRRWGDFMWDYSKAAGKAGDHWTLLETEIRRPQTDIRFVKLLQEYTTNDGARSLRDFAALITLKNDVIQQYSASLRSSPPAVALLEPSFACESKLCSDIIEIILDYLLEPCSLNAEKYAAQGWFGLNPTCFDQWADVVAMMKVATEADS